MNEEQRIASIRAISEASDKYGNLLLALMDAAGTDNLRDVTDEQAARFCREHDINVREVRDDQTSAEGHEEKRGDAR